MMKNIVRDKLKAFSFFNPSTARGSSPTRSSIKVCMHGLIAARNDQRVMRAATALVDAGCVVSIVDIEGENGQPRDESINGVSIKHVLVSRSFTSSRFRRRTLMRAAYIFIRSTLRLLQTPADIYHAHDEAALPACYIAALLRRKQLVFDAHELPLTETSIRSGLLLAVFTRLLMIMVPRCAAVITVSAPIAREIHRRYGGPQVSLIRNLPPYRFIAKSDRLRQNLGLSSDTRIALYQGGLQRNRGLDLLVHAAQFLEPGIVIVMMGQDTEGLRAELEGLTAREAMSDRVKMLPAVPYQELLEWTASADIGLHLLPPDHSLSIRWCLTNKFFEYLMAGLPVLSSQLDAIVEAIETYDVGQIVYALTPSEIGCAINAMLADPAALTRMRSNGLQVAHNEFCWEKESVQLVRLYQSIFAGQYKDGERSETREPVEASPVARTGTPTTMV